MGREGGRKGEREGGKEQGYLYCCMRISVPTARDQGGYFTSRHPIPVTQESLDLESSEGCSMALSCGVCLAPRVTAIEAHC